MISDILALSLICYLFAEQSNSILSAALLQQDQNTPLNEAIFQIQEEITTGQLIGSLNSSRWLGRAAPGKVVFRSLADDSISPYFVVDRKTGRITVGHKLDREVLCPGKINCSHEFLVQISSERERSVIISVQIKIHDINDNAPVFSKPAYYLHISESSPPGSKFHLPTAVDKDGPPHNILRYTMMSMNHTADYFEIVENRPSQSADILPVLRQTRSLDREDISSFQFYLRAIDGGGKFGERLVVISVLDANDNSPKWVGTPYRRNISECIIPNQEILSLQAIDKDEGKNGKIRYELSDLATDYVKQKFYIYSNKLFLSSDLDYDKVKKVIIPILAIDGGDLSSLTRVELGIEDCNDNDPVIKVILFPGEKGTYAHIKENERKAKNIGTIQVWDRDSGESGRVNCLLSDEGKFELQLMRSSAKHGKVIYYLFKRQDVVFDREQSRRVTVRIICSDNGDQPRQTQKEIIIEIDDENDNAPVFSTKSIFQIKENSPPDSVIGNLVASDLDSDLNQQILYGIVEEEFRSLFEVTKDGRLYATSQFDREHRDTYHFTVSATDKGKPPLSSYKNITVHILDVNDFKPEYQGQYEFYVTESHGQSTINGILGKLNATDRDLGSNGRVHFVIDPQTALPREVGRMYHLSGENVLIVNGVLDRETFPIHQISLIMRDGGTPQLSSTVTLTIHLLDINDNQPSFVHPNKSHNSINITRDTTIGQTLYTIKANDPDFKENGTVRYFLHPQFHSQYFKLQENGVLILAKSLESFSRVNNIYTLYITARDQGQVSLSNSTQLRIFVTPASSEMIGGRGMGDNGSGNPRGKPITENERDSNLTILFCLAAIVVLVFVIVLVVFGYIYLRGDHSGCFGPSRDRRDDGTPTKPPRHNDGPQCSGKPNYLEARCTGTFLKSKPFHKVELTGRYAASACINDHQYTTSRMDSNDADFPGCQNPLQTPDSVNYYRELLPLTAPDSDIEPDTENPPPKFKPSFLSKTLFFPTVNQKPNTALRRSSSGHKTLSANQNSHLRLIDTLKRPDRDYQEPGEGTELDGHQIYRQLNHQTNLSDASGYKFYDSYVKTSATSHSASNTPILSRTPKITSSFV